MKVFVTGGMGFIGSHIVMDLIGHGHQVAILARDPGKISLFQSTPGISIAQGGLDDLEVIREALEGQDACVHNALYWGNTPVEMLRNDTMRSVQVFAAAADAGVKKIVYTSSTAAMGPFTKLMDEETKPKPNNFYGATKEATESYLLAFGEQFPIHCNVVRPGYTVGNPVVPGAPIEGDARFKNIVRAALKGEDITLTKNDGTQFVGAGDLAKIYSAILHSDVNRNIYFGLGEDFTSWEAIAREAIALTDLKSQVVLEDKGWGEPNMFDLGKIKREFGLSFESKAQITDHLRYLVAVFRAEAA